MCDQSIRYYTIHYWEKVKGMLIWTCRFLNYKCVKLFDWQFSTNRDLSMEYCGKIHFHGKLWFKAVVLILKVGVWRYFWTIFVWGQIISMNCTILYLQSLVVSYYRFRFIPLFLIEGHFWRILQWREIKPSDATLKDI